MVDRFWLRVVETLRRDFLAGLLVFVPVGFTILGVLWMLQQLDNLVLPRIFAAVGWETEHPRFVGVLVTLLAILLAGSLARSFVGRGILRLWERAVERIPIARSLYGVLKQFMEAVVGETGRQRSFERVVLIEYPRRGIYTYAFVTGHQVARNGLPEGLIKVFVPSTPNPTTGYFLLLAEGDVLETGLSVENAFRLIVSAGIAETPLRSVPPPEVASQ